jgi:hypothetical protein
MHAGFMPPSDGGPFMQQWQQPGMAPGGLLAPLHSPPASPSVYDPLSPPVSGSDDGGLYHHSRTSSGAASPTASSRRNSVTAPYRRAPYHPTPSPSSGSDHRRSRGHSLSEEDDEHMGYHHSVEGGSRSERKEATRKQRIEAEQRRRDELRDGYAKLKDVLPVSNSKSSKVSLLDRGTRLFRIFLVPRS